MPFHDKVAGGGGGGGGGGAASSVAIDMDTSNVAAGGAGQAVFQDGFSPSFADACDNSFVDSSRCVGFYDGVAGKVTVAGAIAAALFTTDGGAPNNGAPVYLAAGGDDAGSGLGKLTATPPSASGTSVAQVGLCLDNSNYAGAKTCRILIQVMPPMVNP